MDHGAYTWRWVFYINLPVGLAAIAVVMVFAAGLAYRYLAASPCVRCRWRGATG
jgi:hypothetical protein